MAKKLVSMEWEQDLNSPTLNVVLTEKQELLLTTEATEIFFGGAAGGGKSFVLRVLAIIYCFQIPHLQVYLFRRLSTDLKGTHIDGPSGFRQLLDPFIRSSLAIITEDEIRFWNGSKIKLCHCMEESDKYKYLSAEMHLLLIDEASQFTESIYRFLRGRTRLGSLKPIIKKLVANGEIPKEYLTKFPLIILASNPGNLGHVWLKRTFVDYAEPMQVTRASKDEGGKLRVYIPATLADNPHMDEDYADTLSGLGSPELIRAMLYADWNVLSGAFFDTFIYDIHALPHFSLPEQWPRIISMDYGYHFPFAVLWLAYSTCPYNVPGTDLCIPGNSIIAYREWYGSIGRNVGLRYTPRQIADGIKERNLSEPKIHSWVADQRVWKTDVGKSPGNHFDEEGIHWEKGAGNKGDRKIGWQEVQSLFNQSPPKLYVMSDCLDTISQITNAIRAEKDPEDIDAKCESHMIDALRYGVMHVIKTLSGNYKTTNISIDDPYRLTFKDMWDSHLKAKRQSTKGYML